MKRKKLIAAIVIFLLFALTIAFFTLNYTREGNALIATNFIKNEATYKFDGIPESFKLNDTVPMKCMYCWEFYFKYQSRNSGYGDRTNVIVNPVITNHTAVIAMEKGTIKSAILDNNWDMKVQKFIEPDAATTQ
ncbi:MAG: hypothetical protein O8C62_10395 [Candidatus Methanoperedens sp.]|nr:hypothetical protein [Candidatus Methanoperedens sp.]